jgi:hypothetical protein
MEYGGNGVMNIHEPHEKHKNGELIVYQSPDGQVKLDVRLQDDTVWLTQPLMAHLFQTTQQNISQHIQNIYDEAELARETTHKKFLSVRSEGNREVKRLLDYYNLDMIISVGYRGLADTGVWKQFNVAYKGLFSRNLAFKQEPHSLRAGEPSNLDDMDFISDRFNRLVRKAIEEEKISISKAAEIMRISVSQMREQIIAWQEAA